MNSRKSEIFVLCIVALAFALALSLIGSVAFAEEPQGYEDSTIDYSESLNSIDEKLEQLVAVDDIQGISEDVSAIRSGADSLMTHDDCESLQAAIQAIAPVDNSERLEKLNTLFTGLTTVQTFQLVSNLLLVGVILALIWLVSYRSHT